MIGPLGRLGAVTTALLTVVALTPAVSSADEAAGARAVVRYTEHGVPHITASSFDGLGYGYGFAAAKDNICELANGYLTVSGERSKFLGPDGGGNSALSSASTNLGSDLYFRRINDAGTVERLVAQPAPQGPRAEVRELINGYVAGYNTYLGRMGGGSACRGAAWLRPITDLDVYRHFYAVTAIGGAGQSTNELVNAQPSAGDAKPPADAAQRIDEAMESKTGALGSNGIAVGRDGTADGGSVLLGNPHFPWQGGLRFWQSQLTIPGRFNVSGGSLLGIPLVQIGHTMDAAWTHTVSEARTFGLYEVQLTPGDPTGYVVDGQPEKMSRQLVRVEVKQADGSIGVVERTLYATRYGPVTNGLSGIPLPWSERSAFGMRDGNANNMRGLNTWFELNQARSTSDVVRTLTTTQGVPWVNTIATDRAGNALLSDIQTVPHITDELAARCSTPLGSQLFPATGVSILDGSRGDCAWGSDADALEPGLFGPSKLPTQQRTDYELNANDSHWLSNLNAPLTGFPRMVGDVGTQRTPRTREALASAEEGVRAKSFSTDSMKKLIFGDRSRMAVLLAAETARMCAAFPGGNAPSASGPVPVGEACAALSSWDHTYRLKSRGALLFDRFVEKLLAGNVNPWSVPFSAADPLNTPSGLNASPAVQTAFGNAVAELRAGGIPVNAPLRDHQAVTRNGERIPIQGGKHNVGVLNVVTPIWNARAGYVEVAHGTSYVQVVGFSGKACPDASTLVTYSQSTDPASPHFSDQTKLYSRSEWARGRFCEADINASPALKIQVLR